ncbi:MAG: hypothetical protein ACRYG4_21340 [Janthinobacterium lividum]
MRPGLWLAVALIAAPLAARTPALPRTLYRTLCDGRVETIDTVTARTRTTDLVPALGIAPVRGVAGATFDGCLLDQAVYVAAARRFYAVVPDTATTPDGGTTSYRVLGISVPGLRPGGVVKRFASQSETPRIAVVAGRVVAAPDPETTLDLSGFDRDRATPNQQIEVSGAKVLLRLLDGDGLVLAVADRRAKTVVRLRGLLATTALNVHLTPGGGQVYVEAVDGKAVKTGTAATYDAHTGARLRTLADPRIAHLPFVAIAPLGKAIYEAEGTVALVDLGARFTADPVTGVTPSASFFAP